MFGKSKTPKSEKETASTAHNQALPWNVTILFAIMFVLSIAELYFTLDSFIYLQRKHKWYNDAERARLGFLVFSAVRTIVLAAVYAGFSRRVQKWFHTTLHTVFLFLSTVFWVVSGVLIHQMWGYKECGGVGALKGGLNECHEIKLIEIIAWVIAAVSVVATVPVLMDALRRRKRQAEAKHEANKTSTSG